MKPLSPSVFYLFILLFAGCDWLPTDNTLQEISGARSNNQNFINYSLTKFGEPRLSLTFIEKLTKNSINTLSDSFSVSILNQSNQIIGDSELLIWIFSAKAGVKDSIVFSKKIQIPELQVGSRPVSAFLFSRTINGENYNFISLEQLEVYLYPAGDSLKRAFSGKFWIGKNSDVSLSTTGIFQGKINEENRLTFILNSPDPYTRFLGEFQGIKFINARLVSQNGEIALKSDSIFSDYFLGGKDTLLTFFPTDTNQPELNTFSLELLSK